MVSKAVIHKGADSDPEKWVTLIMIQIICWINITFSRLYQVTVQASLRLITSHKANSTVIGYQPVFICNKLTAPQKQTASSSCWGAHLKLQKILGGYLKIQEPARLHISVLQIDLKCQVGMPKIILVPTVTSSIVGRVHWKHTWNSTSTTDPSFAR